MLQDQNVERAIREAIKPLQKEIDELKKEVQYLKNKLHEQPLTKIQYVNPFNIK